jgi:hypothetical protein
MRRPTLQASCIAATCFLALASFVPACGGSSGSGDAGGGTHGGDDDDDLPDASLPPQSDGGARSDASGASDAAGDGGPAFDGGGGDGAGPVDAAPVDAGCSSVQPCAVGVCEDGGTCVPTATDHETDGDETDEDCGGALGADGTKNASSDGAPACADGKHCLLGYDCTSLVCYSSATVPRSADGKPIACPAGATCTCQAASAKDGVKNEGETDIDCGGPTAPACAAGKTCAQSTDCASLGCNDSHVCATKRSCIHVDGSSTCGTGATGTPGAENDDCCAEIPLTMSSADPTEPSAKILMDKYFITAGRFRTMMDATNGNLQSIVSTTPPPAGWDASWTSFLPTHLALPDGAYSQLGPYDQDGTGVNGCDLTGQGNHTYWMPPGTYPEEDPYYVFDHTVYDRMPMNCAPLYYFAAFCAWDGGRLASVAELQRAWRGPSGAAANSADASRDYPWGTSANNTDITEHAIDWNDTGRDSPLPERVYEPAAPPVGAYTDDNINQATILPPGRSPTGAGPYGHMDLMGLLLVFPAPYKSGTSWYYDFIGTSDFNNHTLTKDATVPAAYLKRGVGEYRYWAVGARCVRTP